MFRFWKCWRGEERNAIEVNPHTVGLKESDIGNVMVKNTAGPPEVGKNPPFKVEGPLTVPRGEDIR